MEVESASFPFEATSEFLGRFGLSESEFWKVGGFGHGLGGVRSVCADRPIEGIPLDWGSTGLSDGAEHIGLGLGLRRGCAGHVEDVFFVNGAVEIIGTVVQCNLGELGAETDPVGGDVWEVV